jgi:hypothetical protein
MFSVIARNLSDLHRPKGDLDLQGILSVQKEHVLRNDRTLVHNKQWYQVLNRIRTDKVTVHECLNGQTLIKHGEKRLSFKKIDNIAELRKAVIRKARPRKRYVPPKGSYWRDGFKLAGSLK